MCERFTSTMCINSKACQIIKGIRTRYEDLRNMELIISKNVPIQILKLFRNYSRWFNPLDDLSLIILIDKSNLNDCFKLVCLKRCWNWRFPNITLSLSLSFSLYPDRFYLNCKSFKIIIIYVLIRKTI